MHIMKHYKRPELYTDLEKNTVTIDRILQLVEKFIF
jgi:hypothetical protein